MRVGSTLRVALWFGDWWHANVVRITYEIRFTDTSTRVRIAICSDATNNSIAFMFATTIDANLR
jgi:hypothetical protein